MKLNGILLSLLFFFVLFRENKMPKEIVQKD